MLTPIEQTPSLVYDPARQQIMPAVVVPTQPTTVPPDAPVQKSEGSSTPQDYQSGKRRGNELAYEQREQAEAAQKLRAAWAYLQQLKSQAAQAIAGGSASSARRYALDAADVASSIELITLQTPFARDAGTRSSIMAIPSDSWMPPSIPASLDDAQNLASAPAEVTSDASDAQTVVQLARYGLGSARDVVADAGTLSHYSAEERSAVDSSMRKVISAMASVEALASRLVLAESEAKAAVDSARIDVTA